MLFFLISITENGNVRFEQKLMNSPYSDDTLHCRRPDPRASYIHFRLNAFNKLGRGYTTNLPFVRCGKSGTFRLYSFIYLFIYLFICLFIIYSFIIIFFFSKFSKKYITKSVMLHMQSSDV